MIKYDTIQNRYKCNGNNIMNVLKTIYDNRLYMMEGCTRENVSLLVKTVEEFISNIKVTSEKVTLERHETEEEARTYFGNDFIKEFDDLLTRINNEDAILAIHGTDISNCSKICDEGLIYQNPCLLSTCIIENINYEKKKLHFKNYESLLNWKHRNYKGLVLISIPYECYYKEGLWHHIKEQTDDYGYSANYKIDPDFIIGYLDVTNKKIIMNSKYNRKHNYNDYEEDLDIFRKRNIDNNKFRELLIESKKMLNELPQKIDKEEFIEEVDVTRIPIIIEDLIGLFNSIKSEYMNENRYKYFLEELFNSFNYIAKSMPLLKSNQK